MGPFGPHLTLNLPTKNRNKSKQLKQEREGLGEVGPFGPHIASNLLNKNKKNQKQETNKQKNNNKKHRTTNNNKKRDGEDKLKPRCDRVLPPIIPKRKDDLWTCQAFTGISGAKRPKKTLFCSFLEKRKARLKRPQRRTEPRKHNCEPISTLLSLQYIYIYCRVKTWSTFWPFFGQNLVQGCLITWSKILFCLLFTNFIVFSFLITNSV